MKRVTMKTFPQSLFTTFNRWYYDNLTGEVVIVLGSGLNTKLIRVIDPTWPINLSESDSHALFHNQIRFANVSDYDLAMQFQRVVRVYYAFKIHSCVD